MDDQSLCQSKTVSANSLARVFEDYSQMIVMKEKIYNPASTNETSPAEGMAAVNSYNPEEIEDTNEGRMPKNFETSQSREQQDDTRPLKKHSDK